MRVIRYTHNDPGRVGCGQDHVLITTLLDAELYPALALIALYHERWEIELVYDEQKTHQTPRRATKTAHLRSETPQGVVQEAYALSLGHYVVRALMAQAAQTREIDPERLSFSHAVGVGHRARGIQAGAPRGTELARRGDCQPRRQCQRPGLGA